MDMERIMFTYRARDTEGRETRGEVEALDKADALVKLRQLEAQGLRDVQIERPKHLPGNGHAAAPAATNGTKVGEAVLMEAKGNNGQLELLADRLRIRRQGFLAFLCHGYKGDKEILLGHISSIQFKKVGGAANGYIQFAFVGGQEAKGGAFQAASDENSVMFTEPQQPAFERIKAAIDERIATLANGHAASSLDDLERLAALRDKGIITEDEFAAKKKQLLGL